MRKSQVRYLGQLSLSIFKSYIHNKDIQIFIQSAKFNQELRQYVHNGPWSVILTESSILFYSIKFLLPAWTWQSCILKSSFGNGLSSYEYAKNFKTQQIYPHHFSDPSHFSGKCARYLVRWQIQALFEVRKSQEILIS